MNVYPLLSEAQIKETAGNADKVLVFGHDISHASIGLRLGEFSQGCDITYRQTQDQQKAVIKNALRELKLMNLRDEKQHADAAKERNQTSQTK